MDKKKEKIIKWLLSLDLKKRYQLLRRMKFDCTNYMNSHKDPKKLFGGNVEDHITYMIALYSSFSEDEQPEWLTFKDIIWYASQILK